MNRKAFRQMSTRMTMAAMMWIGGIVGTTTAASEYLSPQDIAASADGKTLYITLATAERIGVFDIATATLTRMIAVPGVPGGVALDSAGNRLYATIATVRGFVCVIDLDSGQITQKIAVGHTPGKILLSGDRKRLFVCDQFNHSVSVVDTEAQRVIHTIAVLREPVSAALTADGKWLFVANFLPAGSADGDTTSASISVIDAPQARRVKDISLPNGSTAVRDIALSPDGKYAYASHILARYQLPTTQLERGWMNTNAVSVIDTEGQSLVNTFLIDDVDFGSANPWAIACSSDGKYLCVTHAGSHELSIIDRAGLHDRLARAVAKQKVTDATASAEDVPNDLAFLVDLRKRIKLSGKGPRGLSLVGNKAWVTEYFSDSISGIDLETARRMGTPSIALGEIKPLSEVRKGEMFFFDAGLCFQQWQSCATCHPGNARVDGLNWDLLNDGIGNPKNTKSMVWSHKTPPAMISGIRDSAEAAVRAGIRSIQFSVRPDEDARAIDAYLKELAPVPSPHLSDGKLSASALRGRQAFAKAGCMHCHPAPLFTDLKEYNVGTGKDREKDTTFDTPTLVELWRTAPYLHDGRAATVKDVITIHNIGDQHGKTSTLTAEEIADLAEYLLSL